MSFSPHYFFFVFAEDQQVTYNFYQMVIGVPLGAGAMCCWSRTVIRCGAKNKTKVFSYLFAPVNNLYDFCNGFSFFILRMDAGTKGRMEGEATVKGRLLCTHIQHDHFPPSPPPHHTSFNNTLLISTCQNPIAMKGEVESVSGEVVFGKGVCRFFHVVNGKCSLLSTFLPIGSRSLSSSLIPPPPPHPPPSSATCFGPGAASPPPPPLPKQRQTAPKVPHDPS